MNNQKESRLAFIEALCGEIPYKFYRSAIQPFEEGILLTLSFTVEDTFPELKHDPTADEESVIQLLSAAAAHDCKAVFSGTAFKFYDENFFSRSFYERSYSLAFEVPSFEADLKMVLERYYKR